MDHGLIVNGSGHFLIQEARSWFEFYFQSLSAAYILPINVSQLGSVKTP
jgi:hypothetical protein